MCLDSTACFWGVVAATTMFNFLFYSVVVTIHKIMTIQFFDPRAFSGKTLVMEDFRAKRFRVNVDLEKHDIKIIEAKTEHFSTKDGKDVLFYWFDTPMEEPRGEL